MPPTVIICGNDVLEAGALTQAKTLGIKIPGDVSVTGFGDIELASIVSPGLTTVHVPHREMGKRAAKSLIKLIEGQTIETTTELNANLKIRKSLKHTKNRSENI
jgi:LacI family transcriptional regulator